MDLRAPPPRLRTCLRSLLSDPSTRQTQLFDAPTRLLEPAMVRQKRFAAFIRQISKRRVWRESRKFSWWDSVTKPHCRSLSIVALCVVLSLFLWGHQRRQGSARIQLSASGR